ncbi:hypothetical protein HNQ57_000632 [Zhongshania antarctica]|uniref:DUF2804 domain-containing protein n=1 Tax=Zhongshania antarctica TaxID=641702 RepID=A0A840R1T1_9GAMM|nr:DUF2804 domain-containing protein [Zhongshania antarctica]MBB5186371.1 hypothetical protein [Zhongshania antarctica]
MSVKSRLINSAGQPEFGLFPSGVSEINYLDYDLRSPMDRKLSAWSKKFKFNQFQFVALVSPELIVGIAIVDLKLVSNAFVYLYRPADGAFEEFSFVQPLALSTSIGLYPNNSEAVFRKGGNSISIIADESAMQRRVCVSLSAGVEIDALIDESHCAPLAMCSRAGYQGWVYTQKTAALPCLGRVTWQGKTLDLAALNTLASVDWTAGYMRGETFWNWASLSATLADGRRLGLNLAAGVNETGFTENALWLDDQLIKVDTVDFQFSRYQPESEWRVRSTDGIVDLSFAPAGQRKEKLNALLIASNFTQHFGVFQGQIRLENEVIEIQGQWGFAEDHYARW